ncbi:MAG: acetolactate synthase small subunit [Candidatus Sumerlaeota bacterium]|nr:acetolactate synthase small subunit [Candidatus Sumerlaeota bacterium]
MQHVISVLVENKAGVLARIAGLFSGRGFNIDSLTVGPTADKTLSRMTIVASGDDRTIEQINKQLNKLIDVVKVQDLSGERHIERELVLISVSCTPKNRGEIIALVEVFASRILDVFDKGLIVETSGDRQKIADFIELLRPYGIREVIRTGRIAISRTLSSGSEK